jgi:lysylphosphatidylglycerol synthetase-like protein (DUF2156 family)
MKKIIILLLIIWASFLSANSVSANPPRDTSDKKSSGIPVSVPINMSKFLPSICTSSDTCYVPKWTTWFQVVMAWIIKYALFISSLAGVLFIVINWILYSMAWMSDSLKTESKDRIVKTLIGIVLLLMSWTILHILAPWVYL